MSNTRWKSFVNGGWGVALLLLGILIGSHHINTTAISPAHADVAPLPAESSLLRKSSESFRAVAKTVGPAVVIVKSMHSAPSPRMPQGGEGYGGPGGDPFFDLFRGFGMPPGQGGRHGEQGGEAMGSGFIIDKRGYILTNNHVVNGASRIRVTLSDDDSTELTAKLVGNDPRTDLAVLKIEAKRELPVINWADSDSVEVGDWAIAIGSPFMLSHSVTAGIISAKGRNANELMGSGYGLGMLQTDAAINPGNSGGPLCSVDAKVMGVNTAIYTQSGGYMGIGFAIPSNIARQIADTLITKGRVTRGWLGVQIQKMDSEMAQDLGVKQGVLVHQVEPGSPAARSRLMPGDVIVDENGKPVTDTADLQARIGVEKPGNTITLRVISYEDKQPRNVTVTIGELPAEDHQAPRG